MGSESDQKRGKPRVEFGRLGRKQHRKGFRRVKSPRKQILDDKCRTVTSGGAMLVLRGPWRKSIYRHLLTLRYQVSLESSHLPMHHPAATDGFYIDFNRVGFSD